MSNLLACFHHLPGDRANGRGEYRIELFGDVGYLILDPSWKTVTWRNGDIGRMGHGSILTREFYTEGSPSLAKT